MRLVQLFEQTPADANNDRNIKIATEILANCQPFLKEWGEIPDPDYAIYRGMKKIWPGVMTVTKEKRRPLGMETSEQAEIDNYFLKTFGHKYRSSHVLFCTTDAGTADEFGWVHVIIPVGNYSYLWSPNIQDINYIDYSKSWNSLLDRIKAAQWMHNKGIKHSDGNEVMLHTQQYYAIPQNIYDQSIYPALIELTKQR